MVTLRQAADGLCRRVAAFLQANVAAAVLQVVLVAAAFVASKRLNSWYRLHSAPFPSFVACRMQLAEISMRNAMYVCLCFVAFWACFVSCVRSPSSPARRLGPLR